MLLAIDVGNTNTVLGLFDLPDPDRLLAEHQRLLTRSVALHLGRGRVDPQELEGQAVALLWPESDLQHPRLPAQAQFGGHGGFQAVVRGSFVHGGSS